MLVQSGSEGTPSLGHQGSWSQVKQVQNPKWVQVMVKGMMALEAIDMRVYNHTSQCHLRASIHTSNVAV